MIMGEEQHNVNTCLTAQNPTALTYSLSVNAETPPCGVGFLLLLGSLTITYFHTGNPHY
ncbi:hypothetical protein P3T43_005091, partial [Paraburkholderia sp. GAS41]